MISKYKVLAISVVLLALVSFFPLNAKAQENTTPPTDTTVSGQADQALTQSATLDDQLEPLDGVKIDEVKSVPSNFGFWWKNIKEWTSLALTIDPVKKSEKLLRFAEERTRLANYIIQNSADQKVQEKAQKMLEKANEYMQKISDKKDDLIKKGDENSQKLLRNIVKHNLNKERILEKIEDKLPPEKIEDFQQLRKAIEEKDKNFLDNLQNNPNIPKEVKDRDSNVLSQVKDIQQVRDGIRIQQKDILDAIKTGNQDAKDQFEKLREERKQNLEQLKEQFKKQKDEIINKIKEGDKDAVEKLKELNQEQQKEALKIRAEIKKKTEETRNELQNKKQGELQKIKELNQERQKKAEVLRNEIEKKRQEQLKNTVQPRINQ
ncbi:MAG: hypothetical protein HY219_00255 [Candidatus Staskawiczbacteria bacterium]|nr:hypothetical protein [Candidatus Staskawiczbacteria bacterium]